MNITHAPSENRYDTMLYRRTGVSGLQLSALSLGLWHNFGGEADFQNARKLMCHAFDKGITHFDLANNYGPPPGSAEETLGKILKSDLSAYRDEMIISTKAGYRMQPGPYGRGSTRKYLLSSLDRSLSRMGLDFVDIFYSHLFDPETPLEETMGALVSAVQQGKALYVGISSYSAAKTREASAILKSMGVRCLIHQPSYSMLNRWVEGGLLDALADEGIGCIAFSPLAQGLLTGKYLNGVPADSRLGHGAPSFKSEFLNESNFEKIRHLSDIAARRGQSLAQMALSWVLKDSRITTALIGASKTSQIDENIAALSNITFTKEELAEIDTWATDAGLNLWAASSQAG